MLFVLNSLINNRLITKKNIILNARCAKYSQAVNVKQESLADARITRDSSACM